MKKYLPATILSFFIFCALLLPPGTASSQTISTSSSSGRLAISDSVTSRLAERIKLYPVPVKSELIVENISGITMIEIFDVTGNKFRNEVCSNHDQIIIPVEELRRGIYFIKFITPRSTLMKRFIKE